MTTVPMIAYALDVWLCTAFVMDIRGGGGVYTLLFNWGYDWMRYKIRAR
ncbi:hypothetical protein ACSF85_08720 [Moraxella bovoculi]